MASRRLRKAISWRAWFFADPLAATGHLKKLNRGRRSNPNWLDVMVWVYLPLNASHFYRRT